MKKEHKQFAGDLILRTLAEAVGMIFSTITFSILSRSLTKSDYAVTNQLVTLGTLVAPILLIKMNSAFCVFFPGEANHYILKSRFFSTLLLTVFFCIPVIFGLSIFNTNFSVSMFGTVAYADMIYIMAIYYVFLALATLSQDFFRAIGKIKFSSFLMMVSSVIKCGIFIIVFIDRKILTLKLVLWIHCLIEIIIFLIAIVYVFYYLKSLPLKIEFRPLKKYYRYALPLMPYLILNWINTSIGKFILNHMMGLDESASYSFNYAMITRLFVLNTVIAYTIFPYIARFWNEGNKANVTLYLKKAFNISIFFGIPLCLGLLAVQPTIVSLLSGGNYEVDRIMCIVLCLSMLFNTLYMIFSYLIDLSQKTIWYTAILIITAVINIMLNIIFIPIWGMYGAAFTILITNVLQAFLTIVIGTKVTHLKIKIDFLYILKILIISIIMFVGTCYIYNDSGLINFGISVITGICIYFILNYLINKITKGTFV